MWCSGHLHLNNHCWPLSISASWPGEFLKNAIVSTTSFSPICVWQLGCIAALCFISTPRDHWCTTRCPPQTWKLTAQGIRPRSCTCVMHLQDAYTLIKHDQEHSNSKMVLIDCHQTSTFHTQIFELAKTCWLHASKIKHEVFVNLSSEHPWDHPSTGQTTKSRIWATQSQLSKSSHTWVVHTNIPST